MTEERLKHFVKLAQVELELAISDWPPFRDKHEAYAHILEELDELWDAIRSDEGTETMIHEALQVAAMAIRFCIDSENFPH
jgi:hypothetical protein